MLSLLDFDITKPNAFFIRFWYKETQSFLYFILISRKAVLSLSDFNMKKYSAFFIGLWYEETQCFLLCSLISINAVLSLLDFNMKKWSVFFVGLWEQETLRSSYWTWISTKTEEFFYQFWHQETQCFLHCTLTSKNAEFSLLDFDIKKRGASFIGL